MNLTMNSKNHISMSWVEQWRAARRSTSPSDAGTERRARGAAAGAGGTWTPEEEFNGPGSRSSCRRYGLSVSAAAGGGGGDGDSLFAAGVLFARGKWCRTVIRSLTLVDLGSPGQRVCLPVVLFFTVNIAGFFPSANLGDLTLFSLVLEILPKSNNYFLNYYQLI